MDSNPRNSKYPWDKWFDKMLSKRCTSITLNDTDHYACATHAMAVQVRRAAAKRGIKVSVLILEHALTISLRETAMNGAPPSSTNVSPVAIADADQQQRPTSAIPSRHRDRTAAKQSGLWRQRWVVTCSALAEIGGEAVVADIRDEVCKEPSFKTQGREEPELKQPKYYFNHALRRAIFKGYIARDGDRLTLTVKGADLVRVDG